MKLSSTLQRFISIVFLVALCGGYAHAQRLVVVGWNIESGGATDAAVAQRVRRFQGVDIWGLAEVGKRHVLTVFRGRQQRMRERRGLQANSEHDGLRRPSGNSLQRDALAVSRIAGTAPGHLQRGHAAAGPLSAFATGRRVRGHSFKSAIFFYGKPLSARRQQLAPRPGAEAQRVG